MFNKFIETLEDKLQPIESHVLCGRAWVKEIFKVNEAIIAGCIIETGKIKYDGHYRVKRNGKVIYEQWGVTELKHFAINVDEVESGDECGLKLEFQDWKSEDLVECLDIIQEKNKIEPPIFDLDPSLQQSLYYFDSNRDGNVNSPVHEAGTVFSFSNDNETVTEKLQKEYDDYIDDTEFDGKKHKNTSEAQRVRAKKDDKGRYQFESV